MTKLWQIMPSMAFKKGLYDGILSIREARVHGDFGVGQFTALDGELIVSEGAFYRATSDGAVRLADDTDGLCFAQMCFYQGHQSWDAPANIDDQSFGAFLDEVLPFRNSFRAFRITGIFAKVVPTAPPKLAKPYPRFDAVGAMRKAFPVANINGRIVGYYSPAFTDEVGVAGYHFHFISDDRTSGGHVTSFSLTSGQVDAVRIDDFTLILPTTTAYEACVLP